MITQQAFEEKIRGPLEALVAVLEENDVPYLMAFSMLDEMVESTEIRMTLSSKPGSSVEVQDERLLRAAHNLMRDDDMPESVAEGKAN